LTHRRWRTGARRILCVLCSALFA